MSADRQLALAEARDPIALSTLQPGLSAFHTARGYVPYVERAGTTLTLGPPVCAPEALEEVSHAFLDRFPRATFFYVTAAQHRRMALDRHFAWPAGADHVLPLPTPAWPKEAASAARKARRAGFRVRELSGAELGALEGPMREAQRAYLERREVSSEMSFLTRPCLFAQERHGRTFALEVGEAFLGFVVLDPYRTEENRAGFLLNLFRIGPTRLWGVYQATVVALAEQLASEGAAELSLGFLPLAPTADPLPWWLGAQVDGLRRFARRSPYLEGLARLKTRLPTRQEPRYFVTRRRFIGRDVAALLGAMGIRSPLASRSPQ